MSEIDLEVIDRMMVRCGRRCCICRRFRPTKLQVHHIVERSQGGSDDEDNLINGRGGHDRLNGGDGDDDLFGETGNDTFYGGYGADTQTGGAGQDTFVFRHNTDSFWIAGKPADVIKDFQHGVDKIDLTEMDIPPANLYLLDGQTIDGQNYSYFGIDGNENGLLDIGEFAVAVKMAPGGTLLMSDFLL